MSLNSPRPPRPPRPGGGIPGSRPDGPPRGATGIQGGQNDFGDTRTVILSRKNMGMQQVKKDSAPPSAAGRPSSAPSAPAAPAQPQLPKATVVNNTVSCVKCSGSFPILSDEYYGAVVECPDCAAEFVIPTKEEVMAAAPVAAPAPPTPPVAPAPPTPPVAAAPPTPPAKPAAPVPEEKPIAPVAKVEAPPVAAKAKPKTQAPVEDSAPTKPAKKKRPVKKVPAFVEEDIDEGEEVYECKTEAGSAGSAVLAAILVILTAGAGIAPIFLESMDKNIKMAIPGGAGLLLAIIAFVVVKGSGGAKALVVTNKRVIAKSGKWLAEADIDQD